MSEAASGLRVRRVTQRRDHKTFVRLPNHLFRDEPRWIPPLELDVKNRLNRRKNPFFEYGQAEYFLAERSGTAVGRIAAIRNPRHEEIHGEKVGFFGWFECANDPEAARALLSAASAYCAERGLTSLRGPVSFSLNDECGVLVEGFEFAPTLMTAWNPPWYADLIELAGGRPIKDLYSFELPVQSFGAERIGRITERLKRREGATVRCFDRADFQAEVDRIKVIYRDAWEANWGHVPLTDAEIIHMAKDLKPVLEPNLAHFLEIDGKVIGFSLVLPDINVILKQIRGRLFPFGFLKLLRGIKHVPRIRLVAMGVLSEWRHRGLDGILYHAAFEGAQSLGKEWSEVGWVLDDNTVMINAIERVGGRKYRTHRLYELPAGHGKASPID
ncbi:MAG: N-acetyltransferase [Planctomycetes bacterium]|nr:N-acetyltransferase [Planctomycetota bacterium]